MESSAPSRSGELGEDLSIIFVTVAQLIFFTSYYKYIAWPVTAADGSVTRLSLLTADYVTWLPFPIVASVLVIVASIVMIIYRGTWFRQAAWVVFCITGIVVVVSLLTIFPFDFSVIPNATLAKAVPKGVTIFLILQATFYGIAGLFLLAKLVRYTINRDIG